MTITIPQTQSEFEVLETGNYRAVILDLEQTEGQYGPQIAWSFMVQGGEHDGAKLRAWTSAVFSPKSKLYAWTRAAFDGKEIPVSYDWKSEDVIGREVRLSVVEKAKADGTIFSKVDGVLPLTKKQGDLFPGDQGPTDKQQTQREADEFPF